MSLDPGVQQLGEVPGGRPRRVFITVAEVSGDQHASQLIRSLKQLDPEMSIEAHGGPEMAEAGAVVHRDTVTHAAMGWRGALRAGELYRVLRWTRRRFDSPQHRPDLWVGVDSPSMNFHFARAAHERGIPTLQYVAPQLWAWAEWRMKKVRRWVDHLACIFPFEEGYFRGHGVPATFVGHPLFDDLPPDRGRGSDALRFPDRPPVIGLLPGSRKSVAAANFPHLLRVAARVAEAFPEATFSVPTTDATDPVVAQLLAAAEGEPATKPVVARTRRGLKAFDEMVPECDLCVTVSGTATVHVAALGAAMVVVYRGSPVLWNLVGRWLIKARTYAMVNLLAAGSPADADPRHHIVPEFMPWYGPPDAVADTAVDMLRKPQRLEEQRRRLAEMIRSLDRPGASMNVARLAVGMMGRPHVPLATVGTGF